MEKSEPTKNTKNNIEVLVIEDEKNICDFIGTFLTQAGYSVSYAYRGGEALSMITAHCPDVILLDLGLPDMDGMEIISSVRSWSSVPIVVISARTREEEKVEALDAGADDYLTKPIGTGELLARIRTALRHGNRMRSGGRAYHAKGLTVDFEKHLVLKDGESVHLTQIEFHIISLLAQNSGRVMTYDSIISSIWGPYADSDNSILRVNMAHIRRKLEKNPAEPEYIFTEMGIGYRMLEDESQ
jgi:two-component system KDP operon response regulator KdpE